MDRRLRGNLPPDEKANGKNRFLSLLLLLWRLYPYRYMRRMSKFPGTINDSMGPIIGANVIEKGTTNGVITDVDGKFTLTVSSKMQSSRFPTSDLRARNSKWEIKRFSTSNCLKTHKSWTKW
ncbi:MAG: carboxypeptidase-like regulatory domain-containing protein [Parabacteroides johnsonii]